LIEQIIFSVVSNSSSKLNHALNIEKAVNHHKQVENNELHEDISQNNPTQGIEIESGEFGVQDIHEEIIDDTQKTTGENVEQVSYFTKKTNDMLIIWIQCLITAIKLFLNIT